MQPDTLKVIEWPDAEPVTLAEIKAQVGLLEEQTEHDDFLLSKAAIARRLVEQRLGITIAPTKYRAVWRDEYPKAVVLPKPPLLQGSAYELEVSIDGAATEEYTLDEDAIPAQVEFATSGTADLAIEYWAGTADGEPIDPLLKAAILLYVTHQFENRGVLAMDTANELPQAFETMLAASSWSGGW